MTSLPKGQNSRRLERCLLRTQQTRRCNPHLVVVLQLAQPPPPSHLLRRGACCSSVIQIPLSRRVFEPSLSRRFPAVQPLIRCYVSLHSAISIEYECFNSLSLLC
ncbi:uncharacterized protein DS421_11g328050 [Arachis hypogaea]|nr:uncharacterized protein DS421_11g328050 [Arachis hypogaea]